MVTKITSPVTPLEVIDKINEIVDDKQDTLVSGTNIKTINNTSILGSGNIDIQGGGGSYTAGDGIDITNNVISVDGVTTSEVTLATVATSGDYDDLSNKPTIPTVNNATLTITQGGTSKGTFTANASSDVTIALDSGGGASRNIGQIVQSTIPLTDAGLHLLDGSLVSSGSYADFVTYIAGLVSNYPDLFTTEANWQTAVSTYGVCGKFVYDSTNQTVRLPKYGDKIWSGGGTAQSKGDGKTIGMTDGTNNFGLLEGTYGGYGLKAAFDKDVGASVGGNSDVPIGKAWGLITDGSKSGIIADLSTITTALDGYWYIVIATSVKTQIEVDIDEIATDLNGKADIDLGNCTAPHIVETYVNGTSWYRVYSDGWCEQGGVVTANNGTYVALLKQYIDTNYGLVLGQYASGSYTNGYNTKTTSGFTFFTSYNPGIADWIACGYIS